MKVTRHYAINILLDKLGQMRLTHLDDAILEDTLHNIETLRKIADEYESLKKELFKRLYGDTDKMTDDERKNINDFFTLLTTEEQACKASFPELYAIREKEVKVIVSLLNKEIDIDIIPVDKGRFTKGIIKGNDMTAREVSSVFSPIFKATDNKEAADFSELDEILK